MELQTTLFFLLLVTAFIGPSAAGTEKLGLVQQNEIAGNGMLIAKPFGPIGHSIHAIKTLRAIRRSAHALGHAATIAAVLGLAGQHGTRTQGQGAKALGSSGGSVHSVKIRVL